MQRPSKEEGERDRRGFGGGHKKIVPRTGGRTLEKNKSQRAAISLGNGERPGEGDPREPRSKIDNRKR